MKIKVFRNEHAGGLLEGIVFDCSCLCAENKDNLSACDYNIANFYKFIEIANRGIQNGDTRPIVILNFFERLDDATNITPFIDALATLDSQKTCW
jgi:hypothetical protein